MDEVHEHEGKASRAMTEGASSYTRRGLLAAAGAFALAASGLVLPERLVDEAKADNHPVRRVQKRKDQRRHKGRRDLERQRRERRGSSAKPGKHRGPWDYHGIQFQFYKGGGTAKVDFYVADSHGHARIELAETRTLTVNEYYAQFQTKGNEGVLWINDRYFIKAYNPLAGFPEGTLGYGGRIDVFGWHDGTKVQNEEPLLVKKLLLMEIDGHTITMKRLADDDTNNYKVIEVHLL